MNTVYGDFEDTLRHLGLRKRHLAGVLGVCPETVTRWGLKPPEYVWAYLQVRIKLEVIRDEVRREVGVFNERVQRL